MKMISKRGVRKSAKLVIAGIKKLLGSLPRLKRKMEDMNKNTNMNKNKINIVSVRIKIMVKGETISTPVAIEMPYPNEIKSPKLRRIVINSPIKSSFRRSEPSILGGIEPIYRWEVSREIKTVEMSPIKEFNEGKIKSNTGIVYNISSLKDNRVPENNPINEEMTTIARDSLSIFL